MLFLGIVNLVLRRGLVGGRGEAHRIGLLGGEHRAVFCLRVTEPVIGKIRNTLRGDIGRRGGGRRGGEHSGLVPGGHQLAKNTRGGLTEIGGRVDVVPLGGVCPGSIVELGRVAPRGATARLCGRVGVSSRSCGAVDGSAIHLDRGVGVEVGRLVLDRTDAARTAVQGTLQGWIRHTYCAGQTKIKVAPWARRVPGLYCRPAPRTEHSHLRSLPGADPCVAGRHQGYVIPQNQCSDDLATSRMADVAASALRTAPSM